MKATDTVAFFIFMSMGKLRTFFSKKDQKKRDQKEINKTSKKDQKTPNDQRK